jgi:hypothetical protein
MQNAVGWDPQGLRGTIEAVIPTCASWVGPSSQAVVIDHRPVTIFHWIARGTGTKLLYIGIRFTGEGVLVITSHMSDMSKAAVVFAHFRRPFWLFALLPALVSLVIPATAWGDIFKWTDAQGRTNFSNVPPTKSGNVKNVEILLKETRPTSIPEHVATPTEQALLARIESLERQLQARQYTAQAPAVPPPTPYGSYYPSTPPPPPPSPPNYYNSGYDSSYYPSYYPSYYYPSYSYAVYPARTFLTRPIFVAPRGGSFRGGGGHRGRR